MDITAPITLKGDVLIIPVGDLDDRTRQGIDCEDGDFAISRPRSRSTSTVVDEAAAALIEQFRTPRTIVEAVVLFSNARHFDATDVLDDAYRLVRQMMDQGFMVVPGDAGDEAQPSELRPQYSRGDRVGEAEVLRLMQLVEDTEVYLARRVESGDACVLKIQRSDAQMSVTHFESEARVLARLGGVVAPALVEAGSMDGRAFLLMEHCGGLESEIAAFECRQPGPHQRRRQLTLLQGIARAYATLHQHQVVHGDVHPRNVLVDEARGVRVIDFGLGALRADGANSASHARGGVAFFHEPETARAALDNRVWPPVTEAGEQYSVAALLYYLLTGAHYVDFSLGRAELMREIAETPPMALAARGVADWPELEACLFRGLAKDPADRFPSTKALAEALERIAIREPEGAADTAAAGDRKARAVLSDAVEHVLRQTELDQPWFSSGLPLGPTASLNYGAAGVAYVLGRRAVSRQDAALLARADAWACRAAQLARDDVNAFTNASGELSPETVGTVSPYHTRSGVAAVRALIAHMAGDDDGHGRALADFLTAAGERVENLDLTLGLSSTILGAAQLWRTLPRGASQSRPQLLAFGNDRVTRLWTEIDAQPAIVSSGITNLGVAHGWGGFIYATLMWCEQTGTPIPAPVAGRLDELSRLAEPAGRGTKWPWMLTTGSDANYMPGWCNGSAGYVHLWTAAARLLPSNDRFVDLATGAAWDTFDAPDASGTLCCGLAGRAYALLALHRHTGDGRWLERARTLGYRAAVGAFEPDYPHSLYKGLLVLPVLAADLDEPGTAAQPFF
ncbi:MAG TPA: lanthionine synthetase LanC family protein [Vicinamibacterales bacterium]|nr:lanthionine synthetase LanC family protein [Vicinamibacterales bacterium]